MSATDKLVATVLAAVPKANLEATIALSVLLAELNKAGARAETLESELSDALQLANEEAARADDIQARLDELRRSVSMALATSLTQDQPRPTPPVRMPVLSLVEDGL